MKKTFYISGMHCVSCEMLIEKEITEVFKQAKIKASHKKSELVIETDDINEKKIKEIVRKCGYQVIDQPEKKKIKIKDFWQIIFVFAVLFLLINLAAKFNLTRLFPDINRDISFLVALLVGVVASLSTCLAITGGLVMSFSSNLQIDNEEKLTVRSRLLHRAWPQLYFHAGRIIGFFILGGLLGALGGVIQYSSSFMSFLMILVALVMLYVGLNIIGLLPSITKLGFYLPKKWTQGLLKIQSKKKPSVIAIIGALTFFLPCGFTQSMQLAAIASGGFFSGALIMSFFALGTMPVLFSVGLGASYVNNKKMGIFQKFIAAIIILFALYSLNTGLILAGSKYSLNNFSNIFIGNSATEENVIDQGYQIAELDINYTFLQKEFRIKKDVPVRFIINAIRVTGCSDEVVITRLGLTTGKLKNGQQAILEFTPTKTGVIPFSCWMGMINGRFIVE